MLLLWKNISLFLPSNMAAVQTLYWRAPLKRGVCTYFVAIFQVARNPLQFGMLTLFVLKNVPVFSSTDGETRLQTCSWKSTPSLPPNVKHTCTVFWLSRIEILHCLEMDRDGGGGGDFHTILSIFSDIFQNKKSQHAKFQWIPSNFKNRSEIGTYSSLPWSPPIPYPMFDCFKDRQWSFSLYDVDWA